MSTKKPIPVFEAVFSGGGIYPEKIPIGKVADALSAIKRLAGGEVAGAEDEDEGEKDGSVRLLDVQRSSSAVFRFVGLSPEVAIHHLKETGRVLQNPEEVGEKTEYVLRPIKDLSAIADSLTCTILLREAGNGRELLAKIEPGSYTRLSKSLLISGTTSLSGTVKRVGGATAVRCALRVSFQSRLLHCSVDTEEVARKLGDALYERVIVYGTACWFRASMRIFSFTVKDVTRPKAGSIADHLKALWAAGLNDWEKIENPDAYLKDARGNE
jgi:hypothetical protein